MSENSQLFQLQFASILVAESTEHSAHFVALSARLGKRALASEQ